MKAIRITKISGEGVGVDVDVRRMVRRELGRVPELERQSVSVSVSVGVSAHVGYGWAGGS